MLSAGIAGPAAVQATAREVRRACASPDENAVLPDINYGHWGAGRVVVDRAWPAPRQPHIDRPSEPNDEEVRSMTTQTDEIRDACIPPTGVLPVLRDEAAGCAPLGPSVALGGESSCSGAVMTHPPSPGTSVYVDELGWPVLVQGANVLLRCGELVDVVSMPSGLAGEVNNSLKLMGLDTAVLEVVGSSRRWAFFCKAQLPSLANLGILNHRGVAHYGEGSLFTLPPSPAHKSECLHWICPPIPRKTVLPMVATVVACAQTALRR